MEIRLPADANVLIVSDMHIGDGGRTEPFARKDRLFRDFLAFARGTADALVIAGDGFDIAQAWSIRRIRANHRALFEDLIALSRSFPVYYLQGNHDATAGHLGGVLPLRYAVTLKLGTGVHVEHGHALDPRNQPGDAGAFWGARAHAHLEKLIGSPVRIPMRKHYCWSTRLGHWLFFRYGRYLRRKAAVQAALGRRERARRALDFLDYWGRGEWGDIHGMLPGAASRVAAPEIDTLICGHSHQAGLLRLDGGTYANCGSWTYGDATYVDYRAGEIEVREWPGGRPVRDEEYRGVLGAGDGKSFFDWWNAFYRGWLRYDVEAMRRAARGGGPDPERPAALRT